VLVVRRPLLTHVPEIKKALKKNSTSGVFRVAEPSIRGGGSSNNRKGWNTKRWGPTYRGKLWGNGPSGPQRGCGRLASSSLVNNGGDDLGKIVGGKEMTFHKGFPQAGGGGRGGGAVIKRLERKAISVFAGRNTKNRGLSSSVQEILRYRKWSQCKSIGGVLMGRAS